MVTRVTEVESQDFKEKYFGFIRVGCQVGMPILFLISGFSVALINPNKQSFFGFVWKKILRLAIPMVTGMFLFVIPKLYLSQRWEQGAQLSIDGHFVEEKNLITYYIKIAQTNLMMKMGHLWFILILLIISISSYPMMIFTVRRSKNYEIGTYDVALVTFAILSCFEFSAIGYCIIAKKHYFWDYVLPTSLLSIVYTIIQVFQNIML